MTCTLNCNTTLSMCITLLLMSLFCCLSSGLPMKDNNNNNNKYPLANDLLRIKRTQFKPITNFVSLNKNVNLIEDLMQIENAPNYRSNDYLKHLYLSLSKKNSLMRATISQFDKAIQSMNAIETNYLILREQVYDMEIPPIPEWHAGISKELYEALYNSFHDFELTRILANARLRLKDLHKLATEILQSRLMDLPSHAYFLQFVSIWVKSIYEIQELENAFDHQKRNAALNRPFISGKTSSTSLSKFTVPFRRALWEDLSLTSIAHLTPTVEALKITALKSQPTPDKLLCLPIDSDDSLQENTLFEFFPLEVKFKDHQSLDKFRRTSSQVDSFATVIEAANNLLLNLSRQQCLKKEGDEIDWAISEKAPSREDPAQSSHSCELKHKDLANSEHTCLLEGMNKLNIIGDARIHDKHADTSFSLNTGRTLNLVQLRDDEA